MDFDFKNFKKFDFGSVIKFSTIELLKQKKLLMEVVVLFFLLVIFCTLIGIIIVLPMFAFYLLSTQWSIFAIIPFIFTFVFIALAFLIGSYLNYRIILFALTSIGKKAQKFSVNLAIKIFLSEIVAFVVSFFSLYELKLLWIAITGFILFFIGVILLAFFGQNVLLLVLGVLAFIIACILFLVYYVIVVRNFVRTSLASILLIEKNLGIRVAVKSSWNLTAGKAVLLFIVQLILGGIIWVLQQLIFIPLNFAFLPATFGSLNSFSSIIFIPFFLLFVGLFFVVIIISVLVTIFGQVASYVQILPKRK